LLRRYPVATVNPFMLLMPVVGVLSGVLVYGDMLTWRIFVGGVLTLAGVAVILLRSDVAGEADFDNVPVERNP
jgi:O-acetylserine/cysteine efflux transporter